MAGRAGVAGPEGAGGPQAAVRPAAARSAALEDVKNVLTADAPHVKLGPWEIYSGHDRVPRSLQVGSLRSARTGCTGQPGRQAY